MLEIASKMIRVIVLAMAVLCLVILLVLPAVSSPARWHVSPLGDARKAWVMNDIPIDALFAAGQVAVKIPEGKWNELSFSFWVRHFSTNALVDPGKYYRTIVLRYCPEPLQRNLPDELAGAGGWGTAEGVDVSGSLVLPYTFSPHWTYTNRVMNVPKKEAQYGVYTVNAICDAPMGLSLGGREHVLKAGTNEVNSYGGPSPYVTITGNGVVKLGMSKLYWHEYFMRINGVAEEDVMFLTASSIVTNEMVFVSCRMRLNDTEHITRDGLIHWDGNDVQGRLDTHSLPANPSVRAFDSRGDYTVGLIGLGSPHEELLTDFFDFRVHAWWLTDEQLLQVQRNGKVEMIRRGIPKHKGY